MDSKQIQEGHLDVCERLGDQPVFAESWLSAAGDARWQSGHMLDFQRQVESRARRMLRNRKSGLRPAEEYGVPLVGPEKLSSAGVPELVHTKGDGVYAFMKSLESLPLQQLARTVPHGLRQSKLFEALVNHQISMPRALWLVKIIYLNRIKSAAERSSVWTKDLCQYIGELLREGFVPNPKPAKQKGAGTQMTQTLSHENNWDYVLALVRWCVCASILDQELFLTHMIEMMERSHELFGAEQAASVTGELLLILVPFVPFAIRMHRLTGQLATACINILQQSSGNPRATNAGRKIPTMRLDESAVGVAYSILRDLLAECPDAFIVLKVDLPTLNELRRCYLGVQIPARLATSLEVVMKRIESLKYTASPTVISHHRLDVVLLLDRLLGSGDFNNMEKLIETSSVLKRASGDQKYALRSLIHTICTWSTTGEYLVQLGPRQTVAAKLFKMLQHTLSKKAEDQNQEKNNQNQSKVNAVETEIFAWLENQTDLQCEHFVDRSELINTLIKSAVMTLQSLTSHLIVEGSVEANRPQASTSFYGALLLRLRPTEEACRGNSTLKKLRGTCDALIESARNSLNPHVGSKRKAGADIDMLLPTEDALNEQVAQLVGKLLNSGEPLSASALNLNPFNVWHFALEYSKRAVQTASTKTIINSIAVMQMTGYDALIVEFLEGVLNAGNDICRDAILNHLGNYRHAVSPGLHQELITRLDAMYAGGAIKGVVSPYEDRIPGISAASSSVESVLDFCRKYPLSLPENTEIPSAGAIAVSAMVIDLIAGGIVTLQHALSALISDASYSSKFWIVALLSNDPHLHSALPFATSKALLASQCSLSPQSIISATAHLAAELVERANSREVGWLASNVTFKALIAHLPSVSAFHRAHSVVSLVRETCARLDIKASPEVIALLLLKGMNGGDVTQVQPYEQRAKDILCSLSVHRLSQQVDELKLIRARMLVEVEGALETKHQKVVSGAKEETLHTVHEKLVPAILAASSQSPQALVLVAEVVVSLEIKLASATMQKILKAETQVDEHLVLSLLTFGGPPLQSHISLTIKHCIGELDAFTNNPGKDLVLAEPSVTKQLKLILPLLGFVLGNKTSRQELCFALFKLLKVSHDSTDLLVVVFCIVIRGTLPPWHAAYSKLKPAAPALGFTFPSGPSSLRPAVLSRLQAGVNLSTLSAGASATDPWTFLDGCMSSGLTGKAAPFLKGSVRVPRFESLT